MTDLPAGPTDDGPRGEAPKWVPLAGLLGLLLTLLFTTWYMSTEPPHYWKDAAVDAAPRDAGADVMRDDSDAMRDDSDVMRDDSDAMRDDSDVMRADSDAMRDDSGAIDGDDGGRPGSR